MSHQARAKVQLPLRVTPELEASLEEIREGMGLRSMSETTRAIVLLGVETWTSRQRHHKMIRELEAQGIALRDALPYFGGGRRRAG